MPPRRRTNSDDEEYEGTKYHLRVQSRQTLHRRCKSVQPYYGVDTIDDQESYQIPPVKKPRGNRASSSSRTKEVVSSLQQPPLNRSAPAIIKREVVKKEVKKVIQQEVQQNVEQVVHQILQQVVHKEVQRAVQKEVRKEVHEEVIIPSIVSNFLAWLIDEDVVSETAKVKCIHETSKVVIGEGVITRRGIRCCCCTVLFTVSSFCAHKGDDLATRPYENLFLGETNVSLLTCLIEALNRHSVPARGGYHHVVMKRPRDRDNSDDTCVICSKGGNLICCANCPSTYHARCIGLEVAPGEAWLCPYCHCKYCDEKSIDDITLTCVHCLKKYHQVCSETFDSNPPRPEPQTIPFCGITCWKVYNKLEEIVGKSIPIRGTEKNQRWTLVRKMDLDMNGENTEDLYKKVVCNSMICLADKLMDDSFKPIIDRQTRTNLIQSVLYSCGSNHSRANFSRFYTAILEEEGEVKSVATVRLHSPNLAEIPFIATNEAWRKKGMCKTLLTAIEQAISQMGVEHIVIPSTIDKARQWVEHHSFRPLGPMLQGQLSTLNAITYPGTVRLRMNTKNPKKVMLKHDLNSAPIPPTPRRE